MGGIGSSRWGNKPRKRTTADCLQLDIRQLKKAGFLVAGEHLLTWHNGASVCMGINGAVSLARFEFEANGQPHHATAGIEQTECNYGGERPWFVCGGCGARYAVLYVTQSAVACRDCLGLLYPSQKETEADRAIRRARVLSLRLGFGPDLINGELLNGRNRPTGMSPDTWSHLYYRFQLARTRALLMV